MRRYPKKGGQFAIIWVDLLYEDSVPQSAKILFGEIYRLSDADGWCDATNKDFMDLLGYSESTVRNLLRALVDVGQIQVTTEPKMDGTGGTIRRIFCGRKLAPPVNGGVPPKNCGTVNYLEGGTSKKLRGVPPKNCGSTYLKSNKKSNTPIAPVEVFQAIEEYIGDDPEYREAFDGFLANRAAIKKPVKTVRAISRIINRLRAVNCREVEIAMLDKATVNNWLDVYPLKPDELPKVRTEPQEDEEGIDGI